MTRVLLAVAMLMTSASLAIGANWQEVRKPTTKCGPGEKCGMPCCEKGTAACCEPKK